MLALQVGLPGTQEFMIILMMLVFYGGIAYFGVKLYRRFFGHSDEIEELRQRVATLEDEVETRDAERDG